MNDCPQCHGTTLKVANVPSKMHPSRMREVFVRCDCFYEQRASRLLKAARIPERYAGGFADYQTEFAGNDSLIMAKLATMNFVKEYPANKVGLLMVGPVGIGKTHLACAALRELVLAGYSGLFYSYADLLSEIRNTYNDNGGLKYFTDPDGNRWETESQILNHVINVDILLLDELGKVKASEWVLDKIREIIGGRYDKKRTTLVTTNFPLERKKPADVALPEKIGADMVSRLREMCHLLLMDGVDFRQNQNAVNMPDNGRW